MGISAVPIKKNGTVATISRYTNVKIIGGKGLCSCPFCKDDGKNLVISESAGLYKCFSCGENGDAIDFVSKFKHITRIEAEKELGIEPKINKKEIEKAEILKKINNEAGKYYNTLLKNNATASKYLVNRNITKKVVNQFGLGYSGTQRDGLTKYLKRMGFTNEMCLESGLVGKNKYGKMYDKFVNRIMFPIFDANKDTVGFGGRVLDDSTPKYINSAASCIFEKSHLLYGYAKAIESKSDSFILCEGYMDVIAFHKNGYDNGVASLGTAFTQEHAEMLKRYKDKVYLCFDNDKAGLNAKLGALSKLRFSDLEIHVIDLTPYKDPDEFMKYLGKERFEERLNNAETGYQFEIRILHENYPEEEEFKQEVARLMLQSPEKEIQKYKEAYTEYVNNYVVEPEIEVNEMQEIGDNDINEQNIEVNMMYEVEHATSDNLIDFEEYELEIGN